MLSYPELPSLSTFIIPQIYISSWAFHGLATILGTGKYLMLTEWMNEEVKEWFPYFQRWWMALTIVVLYISIPQKNLNTYHSFSEPQALHWKLKIKCYFLLFKKENSVSIQCLELGGWASSCPLPDTPPPPQPPHTRPFAPYLEFYQKEKGNYVLNYGGKENMEWVCIEED